MVVLLAASAVVSQSEPDIAAHPRQLLFDAESRPLPSVDGRRHQLASGVVVYTAEDHTLPLIEIGLAVRAGSYLDPPSLAGLATLTATQLRRGGVEGLSPEDLDNRVDELGARLDSRAGGTRAGALLSVPKWSFPEALDLFFGMIAAPRFDPARLDNARSNLIEGLARRNDNPLDVMQREWGWLLYGNRHFTTRPWTPSSLKNSTRERVVEFFRDYWRPDRMIVAVSGDFETKTMLEDLQNRFSSWASIGARSGSDWPPSAPDPGVVAGLYHYPFDIPQAKIVLGHRLSRRIGWQDRDRVLLDVVAEILGGSGAISRIGGRLRTAESLVYRVGLNIDVGDFWSGEFQTFFETRSDSATLAVELALEEIERLRRQPPHPTELAVVQRLLTSRIGFDFDTAEKIAGYFAGDEYVGRPHSYWQWYVDTLATVTPAEVQAAAERYLHPGELICLVVGRWSEISTSVGENGKGIESIIGADVRPLPVRDASTMRPIAGDTPETDRKAPPN